MTTTDEVRTAILEVLGRIAPELDPSTLRPDESLREQVDLDSFDFLNVLIALHERLGIEVPENDYAHVQTLNGMIDYFRGKDAAERQGQGAGTLPG